MILIQLAGWAVVLAMAYRNETFAILALAPWTILNVAFGEWASGREVIKGWPKDRT
ncbi:MAG TPA: hypothetical protein VK797_09130 [Tepidisphaeraceae bacterium]|nr:hypothetical protein [Tepidisphaeraceae bacterium]